MSAYNQTMALSASKISDFYQCKQKFRATHITKEIKFVDTPETIKGKQEHAILEECVKLNTITELALTTFNDATLELMDRILESPGEKFAELKFGITDQWVSMPMREMWDKQPNKDFFLITGSKDLVVRNNSVSTIIDYKSGKPYTGFQKYKGKYTTKTEVEKAIEEKTLQLDLYALDEFMARPECTAIKALYRFTTHDVTQEQIYTRDDDFVRLKELFETITAQMWNEIHSWNTAYLEHALCSVSPLCGWCGYREHCIPYNRTLGGMR